MSVSRANRASIADWFMPAPIAPTTPSSRSRSRAGYAPSIAASQWSSGSWMKAMSIRSRPSRSRLSSMRPADPVGAVVEHDAGGRRRPRRTRRPAPSDLAVDVGSGRDRVGRPDQPADLRRQDELVARPRPRAPHPSAARRCRSRTAGRRRSSGRRSPRHARRAPIASASATGAEQAADRGAAEPQPRGRRPVRPSGTSMGSKGSIGHPIPPRASVDAVRADRVSFSPSSTGQYTERLGVPAPVRLISLPDLRHGR